MIPAETENNTHTQTAKHTQKVEPEELAKPNIYIVFESTTVKIAFSSLI